MLLQKGNFLLYAPFHCLHSRHGPNTTLEAYKLLTHTILLDKMETQYDSEVRNSIYSLQNRPRIFGYVTSQSLSNIYPTFLRRIFVHFIFKAKRKQNPRESISGINIVVSFTCLHLYVNIGSV